jgi:hypothetical protein
MFDVLKDCCIHLQSEVLLSLARKQGYGCSEVSKGNRLMG